MLELYYFPHATCGVKARLVLHEKQVDYTRRILNRDAGDLNTPAYRALNPNGVVPTLVHDGQVLIESSVIMAYADDAFGGPSLTPSTPLGRAAMRMWLKLTDEKYFPALADLTYATSQRARIRAKFKTQDEIEAYLGHVASEAERDRRRNVLAAGAASPEAQKAIVTLDGMLARMDGALAATAFLCDDKYTLADAALTPFLLRLELLEMGGLWSDSYPRAAAWWERIKTRPSFTDEIVKDVTEDYRGFVGAEGRKAWPVLRAHLGRETAAGALSA